MKSKDPLKKYSPELKQLSKWLNSVDSKKGFFPIVKLRNWGLIKKYIKSKGKMAYGIKNYGEVSYYVLTENCFFIWDGFEFDLTP